MPKILFKFLIVIFFLFPCFFTYGVDYEQGQNRIAEGIELFSKGLYDQALILFRSMIVDPELRYHHGDAYFWIAKCQMVLGRLDEAEKNLEHFLMYFDNHVYYSEGIYQKGRLLFMQNEFESSIQVLEKFIEQYPTSVFIPNAYFWVGEAIFYMGRLDEALQIFKYIVAKFPNSYKFETAKYRISIIEFKKREDELLKLLKWSHMEAMETMDEFQQREKTYEQAISSYQKKLSDAGLSIEDEYNTQDEDIQMLTEELARKNEQIANLNKAIDALNQQISYLEAISGKTVPDLDIISTIDIEKEKREVEMTNEERLLEIKKEAEELKTLLEKLLQNDEGNN